MINSIRVKGFRGIREAEARFDRLNLLIGASGSGKSVLLSAIGLARLAWKADDSLPLYLDKARQSGALRHWDLPRCAPVSVELRGDDNSRFKMEIRGWDPEGVSNLEIEIETAGPRGSDYFSKTFEQWMRYGGRVSDAFRVCANGFVGEIGGARIYDFADAEALSSACGVDDAWHLRGGGDNLAAWLRWLNINQPDLFKAIEAQARRLGFIDGLLIEVEDGLACLRWRNARDKRVVDASLMPEGALRFIALCAVLLEPKITRSWTILLDCPERGLDPHCRWILSGLMKSAAAKYQVIAATRSSRLVDEFGAADLLIANRVAGGCEYARIDPARFEAHCDEMSAGELWECNHFGGGYGVIDDERMDLDLARRRWEANAVSFGYR